VSSIYRTELTTKKWKNRKTKKKLKKRICSEVSVNGLGNPCSQSWRRKRRISRKEIFEVWNERVWWVIRSDEMIATKVCRKIIIDNTINLFFKCNQRFGNFEP